MSSFGAEAPKSLLRIFFREKERERERERERREYTVFGIKKKAVTVDITQVLRQRLEKKKSKQNPKAKVTLKRLNVYYQSWF